MSATFEARYPGRCGVQGRKPGEPIERLAEVEVVDVRRESLELLAYPNPDNAEWGYAWAEVEREGFPNMGPAYFVHRYFTEAQGIDPSDDVTRIEWRYLDDTDGGR